MGDDIRQTLDKLRKKYNQSAIDMAKHALHYCDRVEYYYMWQILTRNQLSVMRHDPDEMRKTLEQKIDLARRLREQPSVNREC